ncbi:MAG: hypothetical protein L6Q37_09075 [Bdellovibrionaceae bacterium]|nr:hypothetical protein [Pseudobdellovibrionaceae bacterium]NUM59460.1 hypothetical protein [Pseudobdellovibrionaceae bacterium]
MRLNDIRKFILFLGIWALTFFYSEVTHAVSSIDGGESEGFKSYLSDFIQLDVHGGQTALAGRFTEQKLPSTAGFSINVYFGPKKIINHPSYISVGSYSFSVVSNEKDSMYPFPVNNEVLFLSNYLNLLVPIYTHQNFALYFGVGYANITLLSDRDSKWVQNYGSSQYELQTRYNLSDRWSFFYKSKWQQINQYQKGSFSFIEMWSHLLGLGYVIF